MEEVDVGGTLRLPDELAARARAFPESSYGATTVSLILSGGRRVDDVVLAGGEVIVKVNGRAVSDGDDLGFDISDVVDAVPAGHTLRRVIATWKAAIKH